MNVQNILDTWLQYSKYDETQHTFNMLSADYEMHRCTERMKKAMQFDATGTLAVLYAKQCFLSLCGKVEISLKSLFSNPDSIREDKEMWDIFHSADVEAVENALLANLDAIVRQVCPTKMLGERNLDSERASLLNSIESVVEELESCHEDVFLKGKTPIGEITRFSTYIHVFDTMAACLTSIEVPAVQDGLYLCFIRCGDTDDCYFTFMLKSNGNLVSINERVNEAFPGQHKGSRNGRWAESKKKNLFPYHFIIEESNFDYKGYSHTQIIDEEKLAFFRITAEAYMPILLAMVCINTKYTGMDLQNKELKYVDTLLKWNMEMPSPAATSLTVPNDSAIIETHAGTYDRTLTSEQVLNGELHDRFSSKNVGVERIRNGAAHAELGNPSNMFIDLYGEGFELDSEQLLVTDPHLRIPATEGEKEEARLPNNEFIGSADKLDLIAYQQGRTQLAAYLRKRIFEEYLAFGGKEAIEQWFKTAIEANKTHLIDLCAKKYVAVKQNGEQNIYRHASHGTSGEFRYLDFGEEKEYRENGFFGTFHPFNMDYKRNEYGKPLIGKPLCPNTGAVCSIEFIFRPRSWEELKVLFGDIPKPLVGWLSNGHHGFGNSMLSVTDPVETVGTVFEEREQTNNPLFIHKWWDESMQDGKYPKPRTTFDFAISFSKRGWTQELRNRMPASSR